MPSQFPKYLEGAGWLSLMVFAAYQKLGGHISFVDNWYTKDTSALLHYLLPSSGNEGFAGFSFTSLATGLNIAMVKFELFRKSMSDIESQWKEEYDEQMQEKGYAKLKSDDSTRNSLVKAVQRTCDQALATSYKEHKRRGLLWRSVAIRMTFVGLVCLFFHFSAGMLGAVLLAPAIAASWAKYVCKNKCREDVATVLQVASNLDGNFRDQQPQRQNKFDNVTGEAKDGLK